MGRRKIEDNRDGLLVLQVRTRNPFGYPVISSNSRAGGRSFLTLSSLMAPSSRFQSAPRTSFSSPKISTSRSQARRSRGFAMVSCFVAMPNVSAVEDVNTARPKAWYAALNSDQWYTLFAANLGWVFDGY